MIKEVNLDDIRNQYLDVIGKDSLCHQSLVESYHILYHIGMLKQDHNEALKYSFLLHNLLEGKQ